VSVTIEAERDRDGGTASHPGAPLARDPLAAAVARSGVRRALTAATLVLLAAGAVLRVRIAVAHQGVIYPDETYQMTEAAHRVVFGYGIVPWEFRAGLRSWIGPGFLLPPVGVWRLLGLDGLDGMALVKTWVALWAALGVGAATLSARRLAGPWAGLLAAALGALSPLAAVYDVHPLADTVAAPLPVLGLALLLASPGGRRSAVAAAGAGVLLVAAVALRPQLVLVVLGLVGATLLARSRVRSLALMAGLAVGALLTAALDVLTWGVPFAPQWRSLTFNVVEGRADYYWGTSPATFYVSHVFTVLGPVAAVVLAVGLLAAALPGRRGTSPALPSWPVVGGVLAFLGALSAIGHKELRFLLPALPLASALAAVGLVRALVVAPSAMRAVLPSAAPASAAWWRTWSGPVAALALTVLAGTAGSARLPQITMAELGYPHDERSAWVIDDRTPRLLSRAGTLPATCGVALLSQYLTWSGGYSYLHRDVPLASIARNPSAGDWRQWANVVVVRATRVPAGYHAVTRFGTGVVAERDGPCLAPPQAVSSRVLPAPTAPSAGMS
jgi:GPI mannosyltransferase 3